MSKDKSMKLYESQWILIDSQEDSDRLALYDAITKYYFTEERTEFDKRSIKAIYDNITRAIDRGKEASEYGKKGAAVSHRKDKPEHDITPYQSDIDLFDDLVNEPVRFAKQYRKDAQILDNILQDT